MKKIWYSMLLRIRHPYVKMRGLSAICPNTEINIQDGGKIEIGKGVNTSKRVVFSAVGGMLTVGNNVFFNRNVITVCREKVFIGDYTVFGPNVVIYDHDHQYDKNGYKGNLYKCSPVIIGSNCWIGANATILRGSQIGKGCIIGAGTVVKGVIPPFSLVTSDRTLKVRPIEGHESE